MLEGPNFDAMAEMKSAVALEVIASGGVTTAEDVRRLAALGLAGCIVGRALYEGRLALADAIAAVAGERSEIRSQKSEGKKLNVNQQATDVRPLTSDR